MLEINMYTKFFLGALFCKSLIESLLDKRNLDHIIKHRDSVPDKFISQISLADHQKAADYSVHKIKVNQYFHLFDLIIFLLWTLGGGLEVLNHISMTFGKSPIGTGLIFLGLLTVISTILSLPQSLYMTFVIEEKYGFNKTTWKIFLSDMAKGALLGVVLGGDIVLHVDEQQGGMAWVDLDLAAENHGQSLQ